MPTYGVDPLQPTNTVQKGERGEKGQKGQTGAAGVNGQKGAIGPKGIAGEKGQITTIVYAFDTNSASNLPRSGVFPVNWDKTGSPSTTVGLSVGESVIDLRTNTLYTFTPGTQTNWSNLGTKPAGPKGLQGNKGSPGDKGSAGVKGADGVDGVDGVKGHKGDPGSTGFRGRKGDKGPRGPEGLDGNMGATGSKGNTGSKGQKGLRGSPGSDGINGTKGAKGENGLTGPAGAKGQKGIDAETSGVATALANFDGTTADAGQQISALTLFGFSSITKIASGRYRCTFSSILPSEKFVAIFQATGPNGELREPFVYLRSRRSITIDTRQPGTHTPIDSNFVNLVVWHPNTGGNG